MRMRNVIAAGLGIGACLCCAIAVTTAQQPQQPRRHFTLQRVTNGDLSVAQPQSADLVVPDGAPRIALAPGPQRVVISEDALNARGDVPGICGDTLITQNDDPNKVLIGAGTAACSQAGGSITVENAWARCFGPSDFPNTIVLECIDFGIESNTSGANVPFDADLRITELVPSATFPNLGCPLPTGAITLDFGDPGDPANSDTWFDVGPGTLRPEFNVLHLQRFRVPNDFEGIIKVTLNALITIPAGSNILIEFHAADRAASSGGDNGAIRIGSNEANVVPDPTRASYIWAPQCGIADYEDLETVVQGNPFTADVVIRLDGSVAPIMGLCCDNTTGGSCNAVVTDFASCQGANQRFCPNATTCPAAGQPFCPGFEGPNSPPCPFVIANDDCSGISSDTAAFVLSGSAMAMFNSITASDSAIIDPAGFGTSHSDVWYAYIVKAVPPLPNNAGRLIVSTFGSEFDTNVGVFRVTVGDVRIPAQMAAICASIAANDGAAAVGQANGFGDDIQGGGGIDNRPTARIDRRTYIAITDLANPIVPGDQFVIHVGSPFPGVGTGGAGVLNVAYLPTSGGNIGVDEWTSGGNPGGRCCLDNGDCRIVPNLADCLVLNGFFRNSTDFFFGRNPADLAADPNIPVDALVEITSVGCKVLPCGQPGDTCFNPIDLKQLLIAKTGTAFGTITRLTRTKLYFKYQLMPGTTAISIDTCGSTDFDSFIEVFKWDPAYPHNCVNVPFGTNVNDPKGGDVDPGAILTIAGQPTINDDCIFDDEPENILAKGATLSASCFNGLQTTETDSCLCFPVVSGSLEGNAPNNWILICIGAFNQDRDISGVNSIDPVENVTFPPVLSALTIQSIPACFSCTVDLANPTVGGQPITIDLDEQTAGVEPICADGVMDRTNDGCSLSDPPLTTPVTPTLNVPFYISGTSGVFLPDAVTFHEDNDYYEITVTQRRKITWRLVRAEFTAQIAILRAGDPAISTLCNTTGFLLNTQTICDADTMDDLTVDVCPGTYYLVIRPKPPFMPVPCGTNSEYLCCLTVRPQKSVDCCPGDLNNDGTLDGTDIQPYINTIINPPAVGEALQIGGCYQQSFCQTDADGNGVLNIADVSQFVNLLITKTVCPPQPTVCSDPDRCQLPPNNRLNSGVVSSDQNDQSFNADPTVSEDFRAADCLCPTETGNITEVCWWGVYTNRDQIFLENAAGVDCVNTDDFTITYYTNVIDPDIQDICPDQIKAGPFSVTPTRTATGNIIPLFFGDVTEYAYTATHPPVHVTAGDCCWISIVNNTTGRCTWRWETSASGDGRAFQQDNQNQGFSTFPTVWDCLRDRVGADLAFCVNVRTRPSGCDPDVNILGQCCFGPLGAASCLVLNQAECTINYDGTWTQGGNCDLGCDVATGTCVVSCQPGDVIEAEGCGFDINGGCDDDTLNPPIVPVGLVIADNLGAGQVGVPIIVCGTANNTDMIGVDSDWFSFTMSEPGGEGTINLSLESAPDMIVQLRQRVAPNAFGTDGCSEFLAQATSDPANCDPIVADAGCLPNGEYLVRVLSSFNVNVPCDESTYRLTISATAPCCTFPLPDLCAQIFATREVQLPDEVLLNDGCVQAAPHNPSLFEPIPVDFDPCNPLNPAPAMAGGGSVLCGTAWAVNNNQDQDWWGPIQIPPGGLEINVFFRSEFPGNVFLAEVGTGSAVDCLNQSLTFSATFGFSVDCGGVDANGNPVPFGAFSECLPEGNWALIVQPATPNGVGVFAGTPMGGPRNNYQMAVSCGATNCTPSCFPGALSSQAAITQGVTNGFNLFTREASDRNALSNFIAADNFIAVSGGTVSEVQWWGYYQNAVTGDSCIPQTGDSADDFTITYYGDNTFDSAIPGTSNPVSLPNNVVIGGPFSQSGASLTLVEKLTLTGQRVQIQNLPPDFIDLVQFRATHAPVAFSAGTCVWIEIVNNTTGSCTWSWAMSKEGDLANAQRDADPNQPGGDPGIYRDGDFIVFADLSWCLDIKAGPSGCFVFAPACNDVCTGALLTSCAQLSCALNSGLTDQVSYDLVNYSSQGPTFEPSTLGTFEPGGNPFGHIGDGLGGPGDLGEFAIFAFGVPPKQSVAWFRFTPTGGGSGPASITLTQSTFGEILVFKPDAGGTPVTCGNLAGPGEIFGTQFLVDVGSPPLVSGTFTSGKQYLIMVAYYKDLVNGQANIFDSFNQTIKVTCP